MPKTKRVTKKPAKSPPTSSKLGRTIRRARQNAKLLAGKPTQKLERYFEAVGRRKTAVACLRLFSKGEKAFLINHKPLEAYFPQPEFKQTITAPLEKTDCLDKFGVSAIVKGGGLPAQAEAVRHALARALVLFNPDFRKILKKAGFLTRDARMRERKKFGLKRARRAPQWQKR